MKRFATLLVRRRQMLLVVALLAFRLSLSDARESPMLRSALALTIVGVAMNLAVILANGGMPAAASDDEIPDDQKRDYHTLSKSTRLAFLADWIPVGNLLVSPGDFVLAVALVLILVQWVA